MKNILEYKGYHTKVELDVENRILYGKIEGIRDLVNFECDDFQFLEKEFHAAVDDYIEFCKEVGKEPDKEYKGTFNVRVSPELHRKAAIMALKKGTSLNQVVEDSIKSYINGGQKSEIQVNLKIDKVPYAYAHKSYLSQAEPKINTAYDMFDMANPKCYHLQ